MSESTTIEKLIGKNVFVRTVTLYYTGKLSAVGEHFITLDDASWVADTGRFTAALAGGKLNEVEPYPGECLINIGAVVDISPWHHDLPRTQK